MQTFLKIGALNLALMVSSTLTVAAATLDLSVTGNGADAVSDLKIEQTSTTVVSQENTTSIQNIITAAATTGGNKISGTTGGSSVISSGDADVKVDVQNTTSSNVAAVDNCGCETAAIAADISNNGAGTDNDIKTEVGNTTLLLQENTTDIDNVVMAAAATGANTVKDTTNGDVLIDTGKAEVDIEVDNLAGSNTGIIGGGSETGNSLNAAVQQNGADSKNTINVEIDQSAVVAQDNKTKLDNILAGLGTTGDNKIKNTTGGLGLIQTGDALVDIKVKNQAGFNSAALDCGCAALDVSATIKKNGPDSTSKIKAKLSANQTVSQTNSCGKNYRPSFFGLSLFGKKGSSGDCFNNQLTGAAATGTNALIGSTEGGEEDPAILTGTSDVVITVANTAGSNTYPMLLE